MSLPRPPTSSCRLTLSLQSVSNSLKRLSAKPYKNEYVQVILLLIQKKQKEEEVEEEEKDYALFFFFFTSHSLAAYLKSFKVTFPCLLILVNVSLNHSKVRDTSSVSSWGLETEPARADEAAGTVTTVPFACCWGAASLLDLGGAGEHSNVTISDSLTHAREADSSESDDPGIAVWEAGLTRMMVG